MDSTYGNTCRNEVLLLRRLNEQCVDCNGVINDPDDDPDVPQFCRHLPEGRHLCSQHVHIKLSDVSRWKGFSVV